MAPGRFRRGTSGTDPRPSLTGQAFRPHQCNGLPQLFEQHDACANTTRDGPESGSDGLKQLALPRTGETEAVRTTSVGGCGSYAPWGRTTITEHRALCAIRSLTLPMLRMPWRPRVPTTTTSALADASPRAVIGGPGSTIISSANPRACSRSGGCLRSPIATIGRTSVSNRRPSSTATPNATADSGEPSTPTTIRWGNSPAIGDRLATRTEHGASCNNLVATLPNSTPAARPVPFDPTATMLASCRSRSAVRVAAGRPVTRWLVVGD